MGGVLIFLILTSWNYSVCTGIEIIIRIRSPMGYGFRRRSAIYHTLSNLTGLIALFTSLFIGGTGVSTVRICLIKGESWAM